LDADLDRLQEQLQELHQRVMQAIEKEETQQQQPS